MTVWKKALDAAIAANSHRPESRYVQLASVTRDGNPKVRTVVFRRFFDHTASLIFCIDCRSEKVSELSENPVAEACWYFPETRQQFRLAGSVSLVEAEEKRAEYAEARRLVWASLSDESRRSFAWPSPGGALADLADFDVAIPSPTEPLDTFMLLVLDPDQVESLDLRTRPHRRIIHLLVGVKWVERLVNP